jgi:hypothetical protein
MQTIAASLCLMPFTTPTGEGLAQILEYSYWPGAQEAERLVIVGEPSLDGDAERYLATLKERFSLPIEYQQIDLAKGTH